MISSLACAIYFIAISALRREKIIELLKSYDYETWLYISELDINPLKNTTASTNQ